jgi:hypothetical protein
MNKKFFTGMAVLLSASLFFFGCGGDGNEELETPKSAAETFGESLGPDVAVSGNTVALTADLTLDTAVTVPTGVKLVVSADLTLGIASEATLSIAQGATLEVDEEGTLTVASGGTLDVAGAVTVASGGDLTLDGATGTLAGTITVQPGGESHSNGGTLEGDGKNIVEAGGKADFGDGYFFISDNTDEDAVFQLDANSTFSFNNAGYELDGAATLNGRDDPSDDTRNWWLLTDDQSLTLKAGSVLTVPGASQTNYTMLTISLGEDNSPGVFGEPAESGKNAAQLVLAEWGYLSVRNGSWASSIGSLSHNFYSSSGDSKETTNDIRHKTYSWNATAGGEDNPGWKAAE